MHFYTDQDVEVTGSKHYLEIGNENYLLDCGAWQGGAHANQRNRDWTCSIPVDKLSGVILSHAHFDHCGLLPKLVKDGYKGKIWSTPATRDLASIIMLDSAKIQKYEKPAPSYDENDAIQTMDHFRCHAYHKEKKISNKLKCTFYDAGHILGSSLISLEVTEKKFLCFGEKKTNILFTGDLGRKNGPITKDPETDFPAPDYIVMESTYGNRLHSSQSTARDELKEIINKTISRGGKVIIPSFAVERAQELIYHIKYLMRDALIKRVPVYVDSPMASNATGVFNIHPECFNQTIIDELLSKGKNPFSVRSLEFVSDFQASQHLSRQRKPCIIISANGMCEAGRILNHLKTGLGNENNTILIVGYMGEGTLGRKLLDGEKKVVIEQKEYEVNAEIQSIDAFSSHADYKEMINWLKEIDTSKLKKIFLVHGDKESKEFFKEQLILSGFPEVELVEKGKVYKL